MVKRITVTLSDELHKALENWANDEGRATANLAAFLLQKAVEEKGQKPKDK